MTVSTANDRTALAGSEPINAAPGGPTPTETAKIDPGADAGQDDTPRRKGRGPGKPKTAPARPVTILCARCNNSIVGTGAGFAYVDLRTAAAAMADANAPKAAWTLTHRGCATHALAPMSPYFLLWSDDIGTVDALLDAMAALSVQRWFAATAWGSLVRGILADTETAALPAARRERAEPEHGTVNRYRRGCRCDGCRTANTERCRGVRQRRSLKPDDYASGPDAEHGTRREYVRGCRCAICRAANTEHNRANRKAARADGLDRDDERHGTIAGYDYYGCRCGECVWAKSENTRASYAEAKREPK